MAAVRVRELRGRSSECALFDRLLADARAGQSAVLVVRGEAGVGKTALLLAGTFLAGPLHHPSPALAGAAIFLTFGSGVVVQTTTTHWPAHRLLVAGIPSIILGLGVLVVSAWTSPPSLALFLLGGVLTGVGVGAIFRASLGVVISTSHADDRAGALATFFIAGYAGLSLPVLGLGIALQYLSPRVTLLIFGVAVGLGILAAAPTLRHQPGRPDRTRRAGRPGSCRAAQSEARCAS
jgi:MFS family permease